MPRGRDRGPDYASEDYLARSNREASVAEIQYIGGRISSASDLLNRKQNGGNISLKLNSELTGCGFKNGIEHCNCRGTYAQSLH